MTHTLIVRNLAVCYGNAVAVADISLSVAEGECLAVVGANGAGKSTLGKAVSGLLHTSGGTIDYRGEPVGSDAVKRGVVYVPEGRMVFPQLSVEDNLKVGAFTRRKDADWRARRDVMFDRLPRLAERRKIKAGLLSGGEQQLLAITRALMADPSLLVLDEPSLGLSPMAITVVTTFLAELRQEFSTTMLLLEQNTAFAARLADHGMVMSLGRVQTEGMSKNDLAQISMANEI